MSSPRQSTYSEDVRAAFSHWRRRTLALLWVVYAGYYLCRVNLAAAQGDVAAREGITKRQLGTILACMKVCYAIGQFVNGALADRFGPRVLVTAGLVVSGLLNMVFAHLNGFRWMPAVWGANGYFQACGWTSVVHIIANWFPGHLGEMASGVIGTSYILGGGFSWLLAGRLTESHGWRYAFWVPAWTCLGLAVLFLTTVRVRPEEAGLPSESSPDVPREPEVEHNGWLSVLANRRLWALAIANAALIYGYHGLLDWTPHYLSDVGGLSAEAASRRAFFMPLGGAIGCTAIAAFSRAYACRLGLKAVVPLMLALAALTFLFPTVVENAPGLAPLMLLALGIFSSPPASLIACAMPADIAGKQGAGQAAGIVDAMAYVGSALSGWSSGRIMSTVAQTRGQTAAWRTVWRFWPMGMVLAAILIVLSRCGEQPGRASCPHGEIPPDAP